MPPQPYIIHHRKEETGYKLGHINVRRGAGPCRAPPRLGGRRRRPAGGAAASLEPQAAAQPAGGRPGTERQRPAAARVGDSVGLFSASAVRRSECRNNDFPSRHRDLTSRISGGLGEPGNAPGVMTRRSAAVNRKLFARRLYKH